MIIRYTIEAEYELCRRKLATFIKRKNAFLRSKGLPVIHYDLNDTTPGANYGLEAAVNLYWFEHNDGHDLEGWSVEITEMICPGHRHWGNLGECNNPLETAEEKRDGVCRWCVKTCMIQ